MHSYEIVTVNVLQYVQDVERYGAESARHRIHVLVDPTTPQLVVDVASLYEMIAKVLRSGRRVIISFFDPVCISDEFVQNVFRPTLRQLFVEFGDDERIDSKYLLTHINSHWNSRLSKLVEEERQNWQEHH